jgi:hypothetical protein
MARNSEYDELLGAEAAVGPMEMDDYDPYGPLEADEASWFAVGGGEGNDRDIQALIARLFGG